MKTERIGSIIREKRIANRYSTAQLAELLGMTRSNLGMIERGRQKVFLHQAIRMAKILCFNLNIFTEDDTRSTTVKDSINAIERELNYLKKELTK